MPQRYEPESGVTLTHPDWSKNAALYQLNIRQFTREGTLAAAETELPRLKSLGADIIWLMPIHPIGIENRKGGLGSPYSVRDYYSVNAEFGTLEDLRRFVDAAHDLGMYVILDWVANHTAWDNPLRSSHPEWFARDHRGNHRSTPWCDWSDVVDLDYSQAGVRRYMIEALTYWVREVGIDGYRCDVAGFVPTGFWEDARRELDAIKPVFMLAEWESRDLHAAAFDATYAWTWYKAVFEVVNGRAGLDTLFDYYASREKAYPRQAFRMTYISNHDVNAWDHTPMAAFGAAMDAAIVLSVVGDGIPMIYSGQEAGNDRQLEFFERDPIEWRDHPTGELYRRLFTLKKENSALWNGEWGAPMIRVRNTRPDEVLSFIRENDDDKVFAVINFSPEVRNVSFSNAPVQPDYLDYFAGEPARIGDDAGITLEPWGYRVYVRQA